MGLVKDTMRKRNLILATVATVATVSARADGFDPAAAITQMSGSAVTAAFALFLTLFLWKMLF